MSAMLSCAVAQRFRQDGDRVGCVYTIPYRGPTHLQSGPTAVVLPTLISPGLRASHDCGSHLAPRMLAARAAERGRGTCVDPVCQGRQSVVHGRSFKLFTSHGLIDYSQTGKATKDKEFPQP